MRFDARRRAQSRQSRAVSLIGLVAAVMVVATLAVTSAAVAAPPPTSSVSDKLICQCGCGAVLTNCPHQECGWGVPAKLFIAEQLANGKAPEELVQYYVSQYGEEVLAAPTKRGFNVTAWVMPFIGLVIGGVAIYLLAHLWAARREDDLDVGIAMIPEAVVESARWKKLEDELRTFD